jgi:hypothetical protein
MGRTQLGKLSRTLCFFNVFFSRLHVPGKSRTARHAKPAQRSACHRKAVLREPEGPYSPLRIAVDECAVGNTRWPKRGKPRGPEQDGMSARRDRLTDISSKVVQLFYDPAKASRNAPVGRAHETGCTMALVRTMDPTAVALQQARREIVLWTTRDGREIPLDEMSDHHVANAIRALSLWRSRLRRRDPKAPLLHDLASAIARFRQIERRRRKAAANPKADRGQSPAGSRLRRLGPRKPDAST